MDASVSNNMSDHSRNTVTKTIAKYGQQIFGFIKSRVNNTEEAQDILQDVWYQLSRLANLDDIESMSGWLYRVARNRVTDSYRKRKPQSIENFTSDQEDELSFKEILLMDDSNNAELAIFKTEFWNELLSALEELPEKQRQVFILNEIEDYTLHDIANQLDVNLKTIISRKGYAVKHLRRKLNYLYQELYT